MTLAGLTPSIIGANSTITLFGRSFLLVLHSAK